MTVREVRTLRSLNKKCVAAEARSRLLEKLLSKGVGLKEMEEFILREERKKMGNRDKEGKGKGNNESNKKRFPMEQRNCEENTQRQTQRQQLKMHSAEKGPQKKYGNSTRTIRESIRDME